MKNMIKLCVFILATLSLMLSRSVVAETKVSGAHSLSYQYYSVRGVDNLIDLSKKLTVTAKTQGMDTHGLTSTEYKWKLSRELLRKGKICFVSNIRLNAYTTISLPKLVDSDLSKEALAVWESKKNELIQHELAHYRNHQATFSKMHEKIMSFSSSCDTFRQDFSRAMKAISLAGKAVDTEIDKNS